MNIEDPKMRAEEFDRVRPVFTEIYRLLGEVNPHPAIAVWFIAGLLWAIYKTSYKTKDVDAFLGIVKSAMELHETLDDGPETSKGTVN